MVVPRWKQLPPDLFNLALSQLKGDAATGLRLTAAEVLGKAPLNEDQQLALAAALPQSSALELPRLLDGFRQSSNSKVGRELVARLEKSPGLANLSPADLRDALKSFPAEVRTAAEPLFKKLTIDDAAMRQKLAELDGVWKSGDAARGKQVFFGKKALCAECHSAQGQGEHIGPDLSKIGPIRTEKDLLESIVIPSSSIARGFESCVVQLSNGKSASGLIRRETADAIYLVTSERVEVRIPRTQIESLQASRTSVMPQGLESPLSRQELGDLIRFLKSLR
jgi:putative heme-binding domain-containing protein